jgi:hypothetical protein
VDRIEFETYLSYFNARDYDRAMAYFSDDVVLKFAGYSISGRDAFRGFYAFFHQYVDEKVLVRQFAGDNENVIIDTVVRLKGKIPLTRAVLAERGYDRLALPGPGEVIELPQFIHYRIENGKFVEIRCVIKE